MLFITGIEVSLSNVVVSVPCLDNVVVRGLGVQHLANFVLTSAHRSLVPEFLNDITPFVELVRGDGRTVVNPNLENRFVSCLSIVPLLKLPWVWIVVHASDRVIL